LQLIKEHGKEDKKAALRQEAEEALGRAPLCGADCVLRARQAFEACVAHAVDASLNADQYLRFLLADILMDVETAHAYCKAASRLEEQDPNETNTLTCRIHAKEAALRTAARIRRLATATGGADALAALEKDARLGELDACAAGLAEDRRALSDFLTNLET
jgi:hypothetical protein